MPLTLTMLRCPSAVRPERRSVRGGELSVGRGPDVDWVLPDPEQTISRRHFTIVLRNGGWHIIDESSNGTYANRERAPIGRGNRRPLRNNDRIRLGPYELEATLEEDTLGARRAAAAASATTSMRVPAPRPLTASGRWRDPFAEPVMPKEPSLRLRRPPPRENGTTMHDLIPTQPDVQTSAETDAPPPVTRVVEHDADWPEDPPNDATPMALPVPPSDSALLEAFLCGLDMPDVYPSDPEATFHRLGETFRVLVAGLRAVLVARAAIKREFRIDQTMIRARGNNPLKFSANDDDAIAALLGAGRRSDMTPADVVGEALRDIRLHELASMTAVKTAAESMLLDMDPERIRNAIERAGGMTLLPAQKKARAWEMFEALHAKMLDGLHSDFDSVFGKAFAKAYEESLRELDANERE